MRSRAFLHVALAILALAAAFHLGARSATAHEPGNPPVGCWGGATTPRVLFANGDLYTKDQSTPTWTRQTNSFGSPVATVGILSSLITITTDTGDVFTGQNSYPDGPTWTYQGNPLGAPTPARQESFGAVKARYR